MKRANITFRLVILIFCTGLPMLTFAQPDIPEDTPIDGGLTLLLAAGAAYGVKKYRDNRKKNMPAGQATEEETG